MFLLVNDKLVEFIVVVIIYGAYECTEGQYIYLKRELLGYVERWCDVPTFSILSVGESCRQSINQEWATPCYPPKLTESVLNKRK